MTQLLLKQDTKFLRLVNVDNVLMRKTKPSKSPVFRHGCTEITHSSALMLEVVLKCFGASTLQPSRTISAFVDTQLTVADVWQFCVGV